MDRAMPRWAFKGMTFLFYFRDRFLSREHIIEEIDLQPGFSVLDFGCGPGSYLPAIAKRVGETGHIYALDLHPLAIEQVQKKAGHLNLKNVRTILSDKDTGLPDASMDVVVLFDIFHMLTEPQKVLEELHRILKPEGWLAFNDHHMKEKQIRRKMLESGLFKLVEKGKWSYRLEKL